MGTFAMEYRNMPLECTLPGGWASGPKCMSLGGPESLNSASFLLCVILSNVFLRKGICIQKLLLGNYNEMLRLAYTLSELSYVRPMQRGNLLILAALCRLQAQNQLGVYFIPSILQGNSVLCKWCYLLLCFVTTALWSSFYWERVPGQRSSSKLLEWDLSLTVQFMGWYSNLCSTFSLLSFSVSVYKCICKNYRCSKGCEINNQAIFLGFNPVTEQKLARSWSTNGSRSTVKQIDVKGRP